MSLIYDGTTLPPLLPLDTEGEEGREAAQESDLTAPEVSDGSTEVAEDGKPAEGDSEAAPEVQDVQEPTLAEILGTLTIPQVQALIEEGTYTTEQVVDAEATREKPRAGILALA